MTEFFPDLAILIIIYLAAAVVLPDEVPEDGLSLRDYYFETARYFWSLTALALVLVMLILGPRYTGGTDIVAIAHQQAANQNLFLLIGAILLIFVRRPWVHAIVIIYTVGSTAWDYATGALTLHATS
jgi:hypothetical protein